MTGTSWTGAGPPSSGMASRDRDAAGRPRNARPRDGLGRPLPYGAAGVDRAEEGVRRTPAHTLAQAQQLLDDGMPFHAHEVLEDAWKLAAEPERAMWRGLAQLAVGLTHVRRGNAAGARALLSRGTQSLSAYSSRGPYGVDIDGLTRWAQQLVTAIADGAIDVANRADAPRLTSQA